MRIYRLFLPAIIVLCFGCGHHANKPDVSNVKVDVPVLRFEKDLFSIDTTQMVPALMQLQKKYPSFLPIFLNSILAIDPRQDTGYQFRELRRFIRQNYFVYDSALKVYPNLDAFQKDITEAFKYVKYYYPQYPVPKVISLVGPIDALAKMNDMYIPDFLGKDFLGVSLQFYLGKNFSIYNNNDYQLNIVPAFRSRRFQREYMVADAMQLVADDIYPDTSTTQPMIARMVEKGKQWYMMQHFMPDAPDSIITGFTGNQLQWTRSNEGNAWAFLIKNEDIYTVNPEAIQTYLGEAPFTQGMPESSPGNIGQWIGWRIVQAFAEKNAGLSLQQVLATPARKIFEESKYRPK
jgi:hypothetical protein